MTDQDYKDYNRVTFLVTNLLEREVGKVWIRCVESTVGILHQFRAKIPLTFAMVVGLGDSGCNIVPESPLNFTLNFDWGILAVISCQNPPEFRLGDSGSNFVPKSPVTFEIGGFVYATSAKIPP